MGVLIQRPWRELPAVPIGARTYRLVGKRDVGLVSLAAITALRRGCVVAALMSGRDRRMLPGFRDCAASRATTGRGFRRWREHPGTGRPVRGPGACPSPRGRVGWEPA